MPARAFSTDLYQLTMMAGYFAARRHDETATFELFARRMPAHRGVLIAAGLELALDYIERLAFGAAEIEWLRAHPVFARVPPAFFSYLADFRFAGEVYAMAEGTPFFPNEPFLRVTAPLAQAQLLETALLALVNFQTSIASKGVRVVHAARGKPVLEFGARRAHGPDAALLAARAAYLAGCSATSYVEAGRRYGIPLSGTMAHSWVLAAESERRAFEEYSAVFGAHTALLIDTFDVIAAAEMIVTSGLRPPAVRIDSGEPGGLSREVRRTLDRGGLRDTRILVSGDLDEWTIRDLEAGGAPIDGYAVGTALTTSEDAPALGGIYKLVELGDGSGARGVMKRSAGKSTWPARKQVWRTAGGDVIGLADEPAPDGGVPLLERVMHRGSRTGPAVGLDESRARCAARLRALPAALLDPEPFAGYVVRPSAALAQLLE